MDKNKPQKKASEMIRDLIDFLDNEQEEPDDIRTMPLTLINEELAQEGIDTYSFIAKVKSAVSKSKAKDTLKEAHEKNSYLLNLIEKFKTHNAPFSDKTELINKLREIFGFSEKETLAYCRKFTEGTDIDLKSLHDDISFLKKLKSDDEDKES